MTCIFINIQYLEMEIWYFDAIRLLKLGDIVTRKCSRYHLVRVPLL